MEAVDLGHVVWILGRVKYLLTDPVFIIAAFLVVVLSMPIIGELGWRGLLVCGASLVWGAMISEVLYPLWFKRR